MCLNPDWQRQRNHGKALEAIPLHEYVEDLVADNDVKYALNANLASEWSYGRGLHSTQRSCGVLQLRHCLDNADTARKPMYLQIYRSFDSLLPAKSH